MRPETGNNISVTENKVSIQLPLGGHSFSVDMLPDDAAVAGREVEFSVLTPRTTLVPREEYDESACEAYLRVAGLALQEDETAVASDASQQCVAVMAIDKECLKAICERFGESARFTSPLCGVQKYSDATVWLYRTCGLLYIKVYKSKLRFAEVIEAPGEADVIQLLHDLEKPLAIKEFAIRCFGDDASRLRKALRRYYPVVLCE